MCAKVVPFFADSLVGKAIDVSYKRAGREKIHVTGEVTAHAKRKNGFGAELPYVLITRTDPGVEGNIQLLRLDCMVPATAVVRDAEKFTPVDYSNLWVNMGGSGGSFGPLEEIDPADTELIEYAVAMGSEPLANFIVTPDVVSAKEPAKPKTKSKTKKARRGAIVAAQPDVQA